MRYNPAPGAFYSLALTATTAAPTVETDGESLVMPNTAGGDVTLPDAVTVQSEFTGGTNPYIYLLPYLWSPDHSGWVAGSLIYVKSPGLMIADIAGSTVTTDGGVQDVFIPTGVTRLYLRCVNYSGSPTGVAVKAFRNCYRVHA
jgi:hypothetical protein